MIVPGMVPGQGTGNPVPETGTARTNSISVSFPYLPPKGAPMPCGAGSSIFTIYFDVFLDVIDGEKWTIEILQKYQIWGSENLHSISYVRTPPPVLTCYPNMRINFVCP